MNNCFYPASILLPDFTKTPSQTWGVIACDQFTSEPEYWDEAEKTVGENPSALRLVLPEARLSESDVIVPRINTTMKKYLSSVFVEFPDSMIYVERVQPSGGIRRGIVGMIDLECYDYTKGSEPLIRATEGTVLERIPPRVEIRRNASVELPHVMLLIDDPDKTVIEPLIYDTCLTEAYDTDLMLGGGHITGKFLSDAQKSRVMSALSALVEPESINRRYGSDYAPLLFAVGDGNHSLAVAKAFYEEIKAEKGADALSDPARYALVEIVNLHDDSLGFEPIYRVMFGVDPSDVVSSFSSYISGLKGTASKQEIKLVCNGVSQNYSVKYPVSQLAVGTCQSFCDEYIKTHESATVDYIHDEESLRKLSQRPDAVGFLFDGMGKNQLFRTVILDGALPRKTFSMGHARDKRYYFEARRIK